MPPYRSKTGMKVLMVSKALVVGAYHAKLRALAEEGVDLDLIIPHRWGKQLPEISSAQSYRIHSLRCGFHGQNHVHVYIRLAATLDEIRPDLVHIDEESYSVVTYQMMRLAVKRRIPALFFAWQNIQKQYPPPFAWIEQYNHRHAVGAIVGNSEAGEILTRKGFNKPIARIPQFGVDPNLFQKLDRSELRKRLFDQSDDSLIVGYVGRLVPEKGIGILIDAVGMLGPHVKLLIIGSGPERDVIRHHVRSIGLDGRCVFLDHVASREIPDYLNCMDCLVLPSLTRSNWKEQFGRVLIEAMSCEVPVVGSSSGEIPRVIGDGGRVFPEGDENALAQCLREILDNPSVRTDVGRRGRQRVLDHFTQAQVAHETVEFYRRMLGASSA
jgi:glycosyltransferase involved in cell wall biosynthesis